METTAHIDFCNVESNVPQDTEDTEGIPGIWIEPEGLGLHAFMTGAGEKQLTAEELALQVEGRGLKAKL